MKITIYTTPRCPQCILLKEWLDKSGKRYEVVDLAKDPTKGNEVVQGTGNMIVPSIKIEKTTGTQWLAGFNEEGLKNYLK